MTPQVSILIPTQGRIRELPELLSSLAQMDARDSGGQRAIYRRDESFE